MMEITENWATWSEMPPLQLREWWVKWFNHHGIDEHDVAVPGWVQRESESRQIRYRGFYRNPDGRISIQNLGDSQRSSHQIKVVQLEAEPSRFPGFGR